MKCKICELEGTHPEAFRKINRAIMLKEKLLPVITNLNERFSLNITRNNGSRHKSHYTKEREPQVIEIKGEEIKKEIAPQKIELQDVFTGRSTSTLSFHGLDPKLEKFLLIYRANGYKNKEKAYLEAGHKRSKGVYDAMRKPEVRSALYEIKAIDFIQMRVTGNQIIAGLGKIAHAPELKHLMYDDDGELITDINKWPEDLRLALRNVRKETVTITDNDGNETVKEKFNFDFESHSKAFQELRKHFMEIQLYAKGGREEEKQKLYEQILEKLILNQINPMTAGYEIDKLDREIPESIKIAMRRTDQKLLDPPRLTDLDDLDATQLSDEELDRIIQEEQV